jgi:hypothetical protein
VSDVERRILGAGRGTLLEDPAPEARPRGRRTARALRHAFAGAVEGDAAGRFLSPVMIGAIAVYLLFTVSFASLAIANDGLIYYNFLRRFFGEDIATAYASQFGSALFNAPFYLVGRGVGALPGVTTVLGVSPPEAFIALASNVALVLTLFLGWKLLRALDLPSGPAILLVTLFGTPLYYYTALQPSYKHAVDALLVTLMAWLLLRLARGESSRRLLLALGGTLAALVVVRYANVALIPGALLPLLRRRELGHARTVLVTAAAGVALLLALPEARGIDLSRARHDSGAVPRQVSQAPSVLNAGPLGDVTGLCPDDELGYRVDFWQCLHNKVGIWIDWAAPPKMLFTVKRGLFLWTPLTALAVVGVALLAYSRPRARLFVASLSLAAFLLLAVHALWSDFWTGGFSFSQRFLAGLFPLFLIGTAEVVRRWRGVGLLAATACAAFSLFVGLNHYYGYEGISERDGLDRIMRLYTSGERTPQELVRGLGVRAVERWGLR